MHIPEQTASVAWDGALQRVGHEECEVWGYFWFEGCLGGAEGQRSRMRLQGKSNLGKGRESLQCPGWDGQRGAGTCPDRAEHPRAPQRGGIARDGSSWMDPLGWIPVRMDPPKMDPQGCIFPRMDPLGMDPPRMDPLGLMPQGWIPQGWIPWGTGQGPGAVQAQNKSRRAGAWPAGSWLDPTPSSGKGRTPRASPKCPSLKGQRELPLFCCPRSFCPHMVLPQAESKLELFAWIERSSRAGVHPPSSVRKHQQSRDCCGREGPSDLITPRTAVPRLSPDCPQTVPCATTLRSPR